MPYRSAHPPIPTRHLLPHIPPLSTHSSPSQTCSSIWRVGILGLGLIFTISLAVYAIADLPHAKMRGWPSAPARASCYHTHSCANCGAVAPFRLRPIDWLIPEWAASTTFAVDNGSFDIILDHFSHISQLYITPQVPCDTLYLVPHAYWMQIGACNPMLYDQFSSQAVMINGHRRESSFFLFF